MTKRERAKLLEQMRLLIAGEIEDGARLTTKQVCEIMTDRYPHLIEDMKESLVLRSMSNMARTLLKEASKSQEEYVQVNLFGNEAAGLEIPKCIALPASPGERGMTWLSIMKATRSELKAYAGYLQKCAEADVVKAQKLLTFDDMVGRIAPTDDLDTPIGELIEGLQAHTA